MRWKEYFIGQNFGRKERNKITNIIRNDKIVLPKLSQKISSESTFHSLKIGDKKLVHLLLENDIFRGHTHIS